MESISAFQFIFSLLAIVECEGYLYYGIIGKTGNTGHALLGITVILQIFQSNLPLPNLPTTFWAD